MSTALAGLLTRLQTGGRVLDREVGAAHAVAAAGQALQVEIAQLKTDIALLEKVAALLASVGEARQDALQTQIETLVTQGLQSIFADDTLTFHLVAGSRANTPVVDFEVRSRLGEEIVATDVMDARGGGLAAIVGFLLRLVVALLSAPNTRDTVLLLDETFSHVSVEYVPALSAFLRQLVDRTGAQIILVTHRPAFADVADQRYHFDLDAGATVVRAG